MKTDRQELPGRDERRAMIEWLIGRYPALEADELAEVLRYLRKEASAQDVALIASNERIYGPYRQLARDHRLDRPGIVGWIATAAMVVAIIACFILALLEIIP
ncbi:MAG: hypothetical protein WCY92_11930 [Novosphingobium sp.]|uniref:hypothetical protein n=1 Tax=Tsuneonella sp. CC-YZS046 TaxID=3042152 RepID=UPI002D78FAC7|nr:hypothetical protein [Tsuneonella sp. CC-YZS046]WRO65374.1 hypothetical protein U8326_09895 [Tsuneonella sp. CC-YZS046]